MKATFKTVLSVVFSYLMVISILPLSVLSTSAADNNLQGEGTQESPYQIYSAEDFAYAMTTYGDTDDIFFSLESDINISNNSVPNVFKGVFNGNFHNINTDSKFAIQNNGKIYNLYYRYSLPTTEANCFCMTNNGEISGVIVYAEVVSVPNGAIFCATNNGTIIGCASIGSIAVTKDGGSISSGFVLTNNSTGNISNCYTVATVTTEGKANSYYYEYNLKYGFSQSAGIENSYYDSTLAGNIGSNGLTTEYMNSQEFVNLINIRISSRYMKWAVDTENTNNGYPIPVPAYNARIISSKTNYLIEDPEYISLSVDDGGEIYYTIDGSDPDINSTKYTEPILVSDTVLIKAVGYKNGETGTSCRFSYAKFKGEGTNESPYLIDCEAALRAIPEKSRNACYKVTNDIVCYEPFSSLGDFYGELDGNGHTISNLYNTKPYYNGSNYCKGLFTANYGLIQKLNLSSDKTVNCISTFAYKNYGLISECGFYGNMFGQSQVTPDQKFPDIGYYTSYNYYSMGGFVGKNYGTIVNSVFIGDVLSTYANTVGGFVGGNQGTIQNCLFEGDVRINGTFGFSGYETNIAGGFVGYNNEYGIIKDSTANTKAVTNLCNNYAAASAYSFGKYESIDNIINCSNTYEKVDWIYGDIIEWGSPVAVKQDLNGSGYSVSEHSHNYIAETVSPTCTEDGSSTYRCESCENTIENLTIPALGHDYGEEIIVDPTYEAKGFTHKICARCGYDYKYNYIEAYKIETGSCGTNATYTMDTGKGTLIISGTGAINNYKSEYNYIKKVNRTTAPWGSYDIKSVVIEDGITSIGNYAFCLNEEMVEVSLPSTLQSIGTSALYGVALSSLVLPQGLTTISNSAFGGIKNLTVIEIPDSVTNIEKTAFTGCANLERVTLPCSAVLASSSDNYNNVFYNCGKLKTLYFTKGTGSMPDYETVSPFKSITETLSEISFAEGVEYIGQNAFKGCSKLVNVNMPLTQPVIGKDAFKGTPYYQTTFDENGLLISGTVLLDGMYAEGAVVIPDGVTKISAEAFKNNKSITSVIVPESVKTVGSSAFSGCIGLTSLTVPCDLDLYKDNNSFYGVTNLTTLKMTRGSGTMLDFSNKYSYTPWYSSAEKFTTLIIENGVTNVSTYAFGYLSNLSYVTLPESVSSIGNFAFCQCKALTNIDLPKHLKSIGLSAFTNCTSLEKFIIPDSIESFGNTVLYNCTSLTELSVPCSLNITANSNNFKNCTNIAKITLTKGTGVMRNYYIDTATYTPWYISRANLEEIVLEEGITCIGDYAFYGCKGITEIELPNTIVNIGERAFDACNTLTNLNIPSSVKEIKKWAFRGCTALTELTIPETVEVLGVAPFINCSGIKTLTYPSNFATVSFSGCSNIEAINITKGNGVIEGTNSSYQYSPCYVSRDAIKHINLEDGITRLGNYAFYGCTGLTEISIPQTVTSIGSNAFYGCTGLSSIVLPINVSSVDSYAFRNCNSLESICFLNDSSIISSTYTIPVTTTIIGYPNSTAKEYANQYSRNFVEIIKLCPDCGSPITNSVTVDPTCTEKGHTTLTCDNCSHTETTDISAKGHTLVTDDGKPATCTDTGLTVGLHCSVCGEVFKAQEIIPAKGHTPVVDAAKAPTCTETGLTEGSHCSVCGTVIKAQEVIPANGHTQVIDAAKAPTCTETGLTEGSHCSVCGTVIKAQEIVPATGHTPVIDVAKSPTCTETGLTEGSHCSVCKAIIKAQEVVQAKGHTVAIDDAVPATCTHTGLTSGAHCSVCGETLVEQQVVPMKDHTVVIDNAKSPTCTKTGLTEGSHCSVCGEIIKAQEIIPANGHTPVKDNAVPADCTHTGLTEGSHCSVCGEVLQAQEVIPTSGHTAVTDKGYPATCTETGLTEGSHCSVCHEILKAQEVIPANGHTWNNGVVTTPASCHAEGVMTYTCKNCNATKTEPISCLEHVWNDGVITKEPTYTETGEVLYTCTLCGDKHTKTIPCKEKKGKLTITDAIVRAGDEVQVKLFLDENPGITALSIDVTFPEYFTLKNVQYTDLFGNQPSNSPFTKNPFTISWASSSTSDVDSTGLFAILTFEVDLSTPVDDYPITISYNANNIFDSSLINVPFDIENGVVTALKPTPGDVNRDGNINMKDLVLIQQFINHWEVNIVESAADVNDDGEINMKDLVLLQRYINGWEVVLL